MKTATAVTIGTVSVLTAAVGYAVYFDYRRRNDLAFRKSLGRDYKRIKRAEAKKAAAASSASDTAISAAVASTRAMEADGRIPRDVQAKETYFMEQVSVGEVLFAQGAEKYMDSATAFFRALKVYPQPFELIMIYQKTVPEQVLDLIMKMIAKDVGMEGGAGAGGAAGNPLAAMGLAAAAAGGSGSGADLEEVDDEGPSPSASNPAAASAFSTTTSEAAPGLGTASGEMSSSANGAASSASGASSFQGGNSSPEWETLSSASLGPTAAGQSQAQQQASQSKYQLAADSAQDTPTPPSASAQEPAAGFQIPEEKRSDPVHFGFGSQQSQSSGKDE